MKTLRTSLALLCMAAAVSTCGSDDAPASTSDVGGRGDSGNTVLDAGIADAGGADDAGAGTDVATGGDTGGGADTGGSDLPAPPAPMAYSGGACPAMGGGARTINSAGVDRAVDIYLPTDTTNAGVVFMWHGAGDSASNFGRALGASSIPNIYDVIVVVPSAAGQSLFEWAVGPGDDATADVALFDDIVSCLDEQYDIDNRRVYTTGFSAGALWSSYLLMNRAEYLAAVVTFSGGTGGLTNVAYRTPGYQTPVLAIYGGDSDVFGGIVNFKDLTLEMVDGLREDGHFVVTCNHNGGHTIPFDPYTFAFPFLFDHVYGDGSSPFEAGLGGEWPAYCSIAP